MTHPSRTVVFLVACVLAVACTSKRDDSNRLVDQAIDKVNQGDLQTAKSKLQLAITTDPSNARAHHERGAILSKEGRPSEAIPDFEKAVELNPGNAAWRYELAGKYWEVYQASTGADRDQWLPKVEEQASRAIDLNGSMAEFFRIRADCRAELRSFKGAAEDYRKSIELDPLDAKPYLKLGRLYGLMWKLFYRDDLFDLAEQVLSQAGELRKLEDLPTESESVLPDMGFELGMLYAWRGDVEAEAGVAKGFREKAIKVYLEIEDYYRDRPSLNLQLAQVYQHNGDIPKACTAARDALGGISADPSKDTLRNYVMNLEQEVCVTATGFDPNR